MLKHYLISGRVQGVGYRAFAQKTGTRIGLRGWVRNLHDGRVEALAIGTSDQHQTFEIDLKAGPSRSLVENVQSRIVDGSIVSENFEIAMDGASTWSHESS